MLVKKGSYTTGAQSTLRSYRGTQGLIETLGSMVIFDENQAISDINKYEFH